MPNKVAESLGSRVIFWWILLRTRARGWLLKAHDRLGGFRLPVPAALVVPEHGHAAPEGFFDRADRLVVVVGQLDGHHHRIVLEDFAELAELNLFVESGQVSRHRSGGLSSGRPGPARQHQKDESAQGERRRQDAHRRQHVRDVEQPVVRIVEWRRRGTIPP